MSEALGKIRAFRLNSTHQARAARVVGQFLAIKDCLILAEEDSGEIEDIDEVAAQLTIAAMSTIKKS